MQKHRWHKIEEVFNKAVEYQGGERDTYLSNACAGDRSMFLEITDLLAEHETPSLSLDESVLKVGLQLMDEPESGQRTGETIGRFKIGPLIGRGGMGDVYEADDPSLGFKVAIKLVNESFARDPERIKRFRKEAKLASLVSHPNVAKLFEFCEIDGENLIVMELVEGEILRHQLTDAIPRDRALDIAIQISMALAAAHAVGVIHRDIKPENIIITTGGSVKVLDFGLAKLVSPNDDSIADTQGHRARETANMSTEYGTFIGTPAYMSPEQIRGIDIDAQTDIWSLGVLIYEMLSGKLPFYGPTRIDVIASVLVSEPPSLNLDRHHYSKVVNSLLARALCKDKSGRYLDSKAILSDLQSAKKMIEANNDIQILPRWVKYDSAWKYLAGILLFASLLLSVFPASRQFVRSLFFTQPEIQAPLPITAGLVSYWPADGSAKDVVGANDGELLNGVTYRPGLSGQAFSFDGIDDLFRSPTNGFPVGNRDRTMAMWVMVDEFVKREAIFGTYGDFDFDNAYLLGSTKIAPFFSNWGFQISGESSLITGQWYQIAVVTHQTSTTLYLNGERINESNPNLATPVASKFYCGGIPPNAGDNDGRFSATRKLKGAVDEIRIYDRALSPDEIRSLFKEYVTPD